MPQHACNSLHCVYYQFGSHKVEQTKAIKKQRPVKRKWEMRGVKEKQMKKSRGRDA